MDVVVGVGAIDRGGELVAQVGRDRVVLVARVSVMIPTPLRVSVRSVFMESHIALCPPRRDDERRRFLAPGTG